MSQPFTVRGSGRYCLAVLALCLLLSTELLFNLGPLEEWTPGQVAAGWLEQFIDTAWLGLLALLLVAGTDRLFGHDSRWRMTALAAAAAVAGGAGYAALTWFHFPAGYYPPVAILLGEALRAMLLPVLFSLAWALRRQAARAAQRIRRLDLDRAVLHRRTQEARLKVLEAQIEPHFLFNTLATVKCLYRAGATEGDRMLASLQLYLGAALPRIRDDAATLGGECALASAYLDILQIRMGARLRFAIDVPPALASHAFPPMMLVTLVENAIKHGLSPCAAGGCIEIRAQALDGGLVVSVADDGVGFQASSGSGVGLVNIRARLRALHGQHAALSLRQNEPHGVLASIRVPLEPHAPLRQALGAAAAAGAAPEDCGMPGHDGGTTSGDPDRGGQVRAAGAPATCGWRAWRQRLRARLPQILLAGLALGAMEELHILPIELESAGWLHILAGIAMLAFNSVLGTAVMAAAITASELAAVAPRWRLPLATATIILAAPLAGLLALPPPYLLHRLGVLHHIGNYSALFIHVVWTSLATGTLLAAAFNLDERSRRTAARLWTARRDCTEARRMMAESRLNILKARIEPALLVREIGHIRALYRRQRQRGELQLEHLIAYLQAALPHLHGGGATLGEELSLAQAYLQLHAGSWGERLAWHFDVAPAMHGLRFPPMTLLPLINDALQRASGAATPRLHLLVRLQQAWPAFRLTIEDDCAAGMQATGLQDAMAIQVKSFSDFYGQRGRVSREVDGNTTRVALTADIDTASLGFGLS